MFKAENGIYSEFHTASQGKYLLKKAAIQDLLGIKFLLKYLAFPNQNKPTLEIQF